MDGNVRRGKWFRGSGFWTMLVALGLVLGVVGPVSADSFSDDDGGFYESALDALAERGILDGTECGEGLMCPDEVMERWVMAVWLVRVLDGSDPEGVFSTRFVDIDAGVWWMPFVERLAELGVTKGCAVEPARFCPEQSVTRAQMATFLTRAFFLGRAGTAGFVDTAGSTHEESIDALAAVGITLGCDVDPPRFCPEALMTRGQMSAFVARALNLVSLPQRVSRSVPRLAFSSYSGSYYGGFKVLLVDADGRNLRQLTSITSSRDPDWSSDGSQIAYVGNDGYGLFVIDSDGKNRRQIVENLWIQDPEWSSDGSQIAFASAHHGSGFLYVVDKDGSNLRQLLATPYHDPHTLLWSPDGSHIAFNDYADHGWQVFVVDVSSAQFWQATQNASDQPHFMWSPDGSRIAFNGTSEELRNGSSVLRDGAFVVDKFGGDLQRLTNARGGLYPVWSPDGSQIAFTQYEPGGLGDLFVSDAIGRNLRRLTNASVGVYGLTWSPDGSKIAFTSVTEGGWEIFMVVVDEADVRRLTHNKHQAVTDPVWSPDSGYIAFGHIPAGEDSAGSQESWEIAVVKVDDGNVAQITDNQHEDWSPIWLPMIRGGES